MTETSSSSSNSIGFTGLLTVLFITLKLTHVIGWSWWWVLAPSWIPLAIIAAVLLVCGIVALVLGQVSSHPRRALK